jgi:hypothetical protein
MVRRLHLPRQATGAIAKMGRLHMQSATSLMDLMHPANEPRQSNQPRGQDSLDAVFGAGPFSHQIVLGLSRADGALDALLAAAEATGAHLQALNIAELDGAYSAKLWIKGIGCDAARRLSDQMAALAQVTYAHVEHHLSRAS